MNAISHADLNQAIPAFSVQILRFLALKFKASGRFRDGSTMALRLPMAL